MPPQDHSTHAAYMGRLRQLARFGLAHERQTGVWEIATDIEPRLRAMGRHSDIIKTMHLALQRAVIECPVGNFALFDPEKPSARIVGKVAGTGLTDKISDRHYIIVDGMDGRAHYADVGNLLPGRLTEKGMIVSIEARHEAEEHSSRPRLPILSYLNLEKLIAADGATWLDKELLSRKPEPLIEQGFGAEMRDALERRRQWLLSQGLAQHSPDGAFQPASDMLNQLRQRELHQVGIALYRSSLDLFTWSRAKASG